MTDKIESLTPDRLNANQHTQRGMGLLEKSLRKLGAGRSIVSDKNGVIIAGNATLEKAAEIGLSIRIVETDGKELVVVKRTDLDLYSDDKRARQLAYADNKVAELDLSWKPEQITADFAPLDLGEWGFDDPSPEVADAEPQIDRAAELNEKWRVERGQLWRIGDHRLLCGDSTVRADVERVMGGEKADCVCTDPPYGIGDLMHGGTWARKQDIQFEKMRDWDATTNQLFFDMIFEMNIPSVVWGGNYFLTPPSRCWLVWDKPEFPTMSSAELAWTNLDANTKRIECNRTHLVDGDKEHATQKPIDVMVWSLSFLPIGATYDPFAGSGTTLVACENLSRKCRAIEISPNYCAVILERMETAFPGIEIERMN